MNGFRDGVVSTRAGTSVTARRWRRRRRRIRSGSVSVVRITTVVSRGHSQVGGEMSRFGNLKLMTKDDGVESNIVLIIVMRGCDASNDADVEVE